MKKFRSEGNVDIDKDYVVGIDQSYTGFAITVLQGDTFYTEVQPLKGTGVERLQHSQILVDRACSGSVRAVAVEGYAFNATKAAHMQGELGGAIRLALENHFSGVPLIIPPTVVKKYATGRGSAKKSEILLGVYKKWGVDFSDDNAADSYVLARIAQEGTTLV